MADILNFGPPGSGPKKPKKSQKKAAFNPFRIIMALAFLFLISLTLIPFFIVYALLIFALPKAAREDSRVFLGIANVYLMDFLSSIESGKRVFRNIDRSES